MTNEELNASRPSGYPEHALRLKRSMPVIIMRNINIGAGLANGTRAIVIDWSPNVVTLKLIT